MCWGYSNENVYANVCQGLDAVMEAVWKDDDHVGFVEAQTLTKQQMAR